MKHLLRNKNFWTILVTDAGLVCVSYVLAYLIRFENDIPPDQVEMLVQTLPWIVPLKILLFAWLGLYRGMWRYTSISDLVNIIKATVISAGAIALTLLLIRHFEGFSRSVLVMDALLTLMLIGGVRRVHGAGDRFPARDLCFRPDAGRVRVTDAQRADGGGNTA